MFIDVIIYLSEALWFTCHCLFIFLLDTEYFFLVLAKNKIIIINFDCLFPRKKKINIFKIDFKKFTSYTFQKIYIIQNNFKKENKTELRENLIARSS